MELKKSLVHNHLTIKINLNYFLFWFKYFELWSVERWYYWLTDAGKSRKLDCSGNCSDELKKTPNFAPGEVFTSLWVMKDTHGTVIIVLYLS